MSGKVRKQAQSEAAYAASGDVDVLPGLSERQSRAVAMLAEGRSRLRVARLLEVDPKTVRRWTAIPEFAAALAAVRREGIELARTRLGGALETAVGTLLTVLRDKTTPAAVRVRAAEIVLARAGLDEKTPESDEGGDKPLTDEDLALARRFLDERDEQERMPRTGGGA